MFDLIEKFNNAKGIVVLLLFLLIALFVYKHFDFITDITFRITRPTEQERPTAPTDSPTGDTERQETIRVELDSIALCRFNSTLPCYLELQVTNSGRFYPAEPYVVIDLGRAKFQHYEFRPTFDIGAEADSSASVLRFRRRGLEPGASIHLYALISEPYFESISLYTGTDLRERITWRDYVHLGNQDESHSVIPKGFIDFLWLLGGALVLVLAIYAVRALIIFLNRRLKL